MKGDFLHSGKWSRDRGHLQILDLPPQDPNRGTVLLLHGASANMADMAVALGGRLTAKGYRVLSIDRPGSGWSDRVSGEARGQAEDIRRAVRSHGVEEAIVVAHSLGAVTALALAVDSPTFVRGLVLVSPVTIPWTGPVSWYYPPSTNPVVGPLHGR